MTFRRLSMFYCILYYSLSENSWSSTISLSNYESRIHQFSLFPFPLTLFLSLSLSRWRNLSLSFHIKFWTAELTPWQLFLIEGTPYSLPISRYHLGRTAMENATARIALCTNCTFNKSTQSIRINRYLSRALNPQWIVLSLLFENLGLPLGLNYYIWTIV